jgi:hypothetical protein
MKKIALSLMLAASVAFGGISLAMPALAKDSEKASKHEKMRGGSKHDHSKHDGHDHGKHKGHEKHDGHEDHGKHKGHEKHEMKKEEKAAAPEAEPEAPAAEVGQ